MFAYEETPSNRVSDFRDFVCALFPQAILFEFCFLSIYITPDKRGYSHNIFLISPQKNMYSLEVPQRGASNEYHNIFFCGEII